MSRPACRLYLITPPQLGDLAVFAGRLEAALQRDETILIDLETAIARYRAAGDEPFQIPEILTEAGVTALRETVTARLSAERRKIAGLNRKISELRGQSP
jgi:hypothetical protein